MAFIDTKTQKRRYPFELTFAKRCVHYFILWVFGFLVFFGLYFLIPPSASCVAESAYLSVHVALIYVRQLAHSEKGIED